MVRYNVELFLFLFQLKGCAHVNITVFNEHQSVAGCATNHNFRFCVSCDFALTSFGVAHSISVNDDILYFWAADLRLDTIYAPLFLQGMANSCSLRGLSSVCWEAR